MFLYSSLTSNYSLLISVSHYAVVAGRIQVVGSFFFCCTICTSLFDRSVDLNMTAAVWISLNACAIPILWLQHQSLCDTLSDTLMTERTDNNSHLCGYAVVGSKSGNDLKDKQRLTVLCASV